MTNLKVRKQFATLVAFILMLSLAVLAVPAVAMQAKSYHPMVSAGGTHTVGLKTDGTVIATGDNTKGQCDVSSWTDIIQVSAGGYHTVGLKSDGTVVATGDDTKGQCDVSSWTDIIKVSAGGYHTVGLKSDFTLVATGDDTKGQCDVSSWTDIIQVAAGEYHTLGLKSDGYVVAVGFDDSDQCKVGGWDHVIQVSAGLNHSVNLNVDYVVSAVGDNSDGQCDFHSSWFRINQISAGEYHTVGLFDDGTVIATGNDVDGRCDVSSWSGISQVSAGMYHTVGLMYDGTVIATGKISDGQCNVSSWNLGVWMPTNTTTNVTSSFNPSTSGQSVTFTATVTPVPDSGTIQFQDNGNPLGSPVDIDSSGSATYDTSGLTVGNHIITADYSGNGDFASSTGSFEQLVGVSSELTYTTISGGEASVVHSTDGVSTSIKGSSAPDGTSVTVSSVEFANNQPTGTTNVQIDGAEYYDVNVSSSTSLGPGAMARITIASSSLTPDSTMKYWFSGMWNAASDVTVDMLASPPTISGDIPVAALTGTPIAIGTPSPGAPSSYVWYLDNTGNTVMERTGTQSGSVDVTSQTWVTWLSDQQAQEEVVFSDGDWIVNLKTQNCNSGCSAQVGQCESNGTNFEAFNNTAVSGAPDVNGIIKITINTGGSVLADHYLALSLISNGGSGGKIITDGSSYLSSPASHPGFPVPELPAGILLGIGLAGLGSYAIIRRKKPTRVNIG